VKEKLDLNIENNLELDEFILEQKVRQAELTNPR